MHLRQVCDLCVIPTKWLQKWFILMEGNVNIHLDPLDDLLCFIARAGKGPLICLCGVCDELCCLWKSPNHIIMLLHASKWPLSLLSLFSPPPGAQLIHGHTTQQLVSLTPLQSFFHSLFPVDSSYDSSSPLKQGFTSHPCEGQRLHIHCPRLLWMVPLSVQSQEVF